MLTYNVLNEYVERLKKQDMPVMATTDNITNLTGDDIAKLRVGDVVVKQTGNMKHLYLVTYKEENVGICISYFAAGYSETVSYDCIEGVWTYNSTDIVEEQPKLTAGDNITITDNVISATDTTYTAGDNITINNGVISASSGETIWENEVLLKSNDNKYISVYFTSKEEITSSNAVSIITTEAGGYRGMLQATPVLSGGVLGFNLPEYNDGTNTYKIIPYAFSTASAHSVYGSYYDGTSMQTVQVAFSGWTAYQINSHRLN